MGWDNTPKAHIPHKPHPTFSYTEMFIAQELRKKSIAEYLLYMWQMEDLIRAYG